MKVIFCLCFSTLLLGFTASAQFKGTVTYLNTYQSKIEGASDAQLESYFGKKRFFYIQDDFYKSITHGEKETLELYRGDTNRTYYKEEGNDTVYWVNAINEYVKVIDYAVEPSSETVLGVKCKKLTVKTSIGDFIYYFSEKKYPIAPASYKDHNYSHWGLYTSIAKAVPLKIIYDYKGLATVISTAVEIKEGALDSSVFKVPEGLYSKERNIKL